jgi:signal recognition particle subunit SRP54
MLLSAFACRQLAAKVSEALDPGQQIIKIVNAELVAMLGGETLKDRVRIATTNGCVDGGFARFG